MEENSIRVFNVDLNKLEKTERDYYQDKLNSLLDEIDTETENGKKNMSEDLHQKLVCLYEEMDDAINKSSRKGYC